MIRPYDKTDLPDLLVIFRRNIPKYFAEHEAGDLEKYLDDHGKTYLVCEEEGVIAGGAGYTIVTKTQTGLVTWIFLNPDSAGKGFGKKLVNHCLTELRRLPDLKAIRVNTSQHAHKFFEKFGFQLILTEKDYWADGLDLYRMEM